MTGRRLWRWNIAALAVVAVVLVAQSQFNLFGLPQPPPDQDVVAAARDASEPPRRHARMNGVDYWIPLAYAAAPFDPGLDQGSMLLVGFHPGFRAPMPGERLAAAARPGHGNQVRVLIRAENLRTPLVQVSWDARWQIYGPFIPAGEFDGYTRFINSPPVIPAEGYELYRPINEEELTEFLLCRGPGQVPSPSCNIFFSYNEMLVKVTFSRDFLDDSRQILANVRRFLDEARTWPEAGTTRGAITDLLEQARTPPAPPPAAEPNTGIDP